MPDAIVRDARPEDKEAIRSLMPRLADFEVPESRNPDHLWRGDEKLLLRWFDGDAPQSFAQVAEDAGKVVGMTLVSLRPELLSGEPSAHLEAIAVAPDAEGRGIAHALLESCEAEAKKRGAQSITLHVFGANLRARAFYQRNGYDEELIRCSKRL